jgi:hypothetical protein
VFSRTHVNGQEGEGIGTAARLHERVDESFGPIWRAQENRDAELLRPYVSQAYLERSAQSFDALDQAAQMHRIEDDELRDVAVARPDDDTFDGSAQVYLLFSVRHSTIDLRTGEVVSGDAAPRAWTACWTFVLEPRSGWVVDRLAAVWRARDKRKPAPGKWPGLPAGWYSRRDEPWEWEYWDGSAWTRAGQDQGQDQALVT